MDPFVRLLPLFALLLLFLGEGSSVHATPLSAVGPRDATDGSRRGLLANQKRQAPNLVYDGNETVMTGSFNWTTFVVPIPVSVAHSWAGSYPLLPHGLPSSVIPTGYHPALVTFGYFYDLRQDTPLPIRVAQLSSSTVYVPFVDRVIGTGTPFARSVYTLQDQLVPVLVSTLTEFVNNVLATFEPAHAAWRADAGTLRGKVTQGVQVLGIGVVRELYEAGWTKTATGPIGEAAFRSMVGQPYFTSDLTAVTGTCNGATYRYDFPNANPSLVQGTVRVTNPNTLETFNFNTAYGYTAATQWIADPGLGKPCTDFV